MEFRSFFKRHIAILISVSWILFQLYIALVKPLHPMLQNPIHLLFALLLVFVYFPSGKGWLRVIDIVSGIALGFLAYYFIAHTLRLQTRWPYVDPILSIDIIAGLITIVLLLEAVRRAVGIELFILSLMFLVYAIWGKYFPGLLKFSGIGLNQFVELMVMGPDGIFGVPLSTSTSMIFYIILFGAFFSELGGKLLIDIGLKIGGRQYGGPAKAAVISSGLMGMVSGSAVANVSTTGVITIPLMKRIGYKPEEAGAIEAVASTGGQIMPPIMGVGAFIMAEFLGVRYGFIAKSAIFPALCYYLTLWFVVDFLARKRNIRQIQMEQFLSIEPILPRLHSLIPMIALIWYIFSGASLGRAAIMSTAIAILINGFNYILRFKNVLGLRDFLDCLIQATKQAVGVAVPTAACGIIIGIVVQSGLAAKASNLLISVGHNNLALSLIITMVGCIVLGMAVPTVAVYILGAVFFAPNLIKLGLPPLVAHMFVFYFGAIAQITPPVCLASFTAAGIAKASSWRTGWIAFSYALTGFLVPFAFAYKPELLLLGSFSESIGAFLLVICGGVLLASSLVGYFMVPIKSLLLRVILGVSAIGVILPEIISSILGLSIGALILIFNHIYVRRALKG
ncbi:MAG: TRAP transporter fused permease subunit [Synergistetes bacterium]|nr:TRAP transporter fused permease subunit [Synergistota bacterium]MDW8192619.1 TRAP transporter fused permease subunit [Synergistota bacterium]